MRGLGGVWEAGERLVGVRGVGERLVGARAVGEWLVGVRGLPTRDLGVTKARSPGLAVRDAGGRGLPGELGNGPLSFRDLTVLVVRVTALLRQPDSCRMLLLLLGVASLRHESPDPRSGRLLVGVMGVMGEMGARDERRVTTLLPGELTRLEAFLSRETDLQSG